MRCGARVQLTNSAPVASTSARSTGSASTRTVCPRSTRARATLISGGVVPAPSQVVIRISVISSSPCCVVVEREHQLAHRGDRLIAVKFLVAAKQLPGVDVGDDDELGDPALARLAAQAGEGGGEDALDPRLVAGAALGPSAAGPTGTRGSTASRRRLASPLRS